jgi:transcriptional regulator with XRE-family HTH domain
LTEAQGDEGVLTGRMVRAARALANLDQLQLAEAAGVSRRTIIRIENEKEATSDPRRRENSDLIRKAFQEKFDIEFFFPNTTTGEGARLRKAR